MTDDVLEKLAEIREAQARIEANQSEQKERVALFWSRDWPSLERQLSTLNAKIESIEAKLEGKMSSSMGRLETKIDAVETKVMAKVETNNGRISSLENFKAYAMGVSTLLGMLGAWIANKLHLGSGAHQ